MFEPAVTLSDYVIAAECAWCAWCCERWPGRSRPWTTLFYVSLIVAGVVGGTSHGFYPTDGERVHEALWTATLLSIGVTALAMWGICASGLKRQSFRWVVGTATALLVAYAMAVLIGAREFRVAIAFYLPPAAAMLGRFAWLWWRRRDRRFGAGTAGVALTFVAAAIQALRLDPHPLFDHNALYHAVQALALLAILPAAKALAVGTERPAARV